MKKSLIIIFFLPFLGLAQPRRPKFPIDSATNQIVYTQSTDMPGVKKEKLFNLLSKWYSSYLKPTDGIGLMQPYSNRIVFSHDVIFQGSYSIRDPKGGIGHYTSYFTAEMVFMDEKFTITLRNFKANIFGTVTPLEDLAKGAIPVPVAADRQYTQVYFQMYSNALDDINLSALAVIKNASKYVSKTKKKGLL